MSTDELFNQITDGIYNILHTIAGAIATIVYMWVLLFMCLVQLALHILGSIIDPFVELAERMVRSKY